MADALTWPAVVMGVFTVVNGSVLVPVVRGWTRNRKTGRARDELITAAAEKVDVSLREFGTQLAAMSQSIWSALARVDVLQSQVASLQRESEYQRALLERLRDRP